MPFPGNDRILCRSSRAQTSLPQLVSKAAFYKRTSQKPPIAPKVNSDSPQRTPVSPTRPRHAMIRAKYSHFCRMNFTVKKTNYGPCNDCNLLPTDAGGITSPDIRLIVHKRKSLTLANPPTAAYSTCLSGKDGEISRY